MILDLKHFEHLVNILETEHNIIRSNESMLNMTEAWMYAVDILLKQCKTIIKGEKFLEEQDSIFKTMAQVEELTMSDDELFSLIKTNYAKYSTKEQG